MKVLDKMQNPFALVAQGFLVGGILFWTTQAQALSLASDPPPLRDPPTA